MKKDKKPFYTQWWVWLLVLLIIHILFKLKAPCDFMVAEWSAGDLLTFIGTTFLGYVAYKQNEKSNDISSRMLKIEENKFTPYIKLNILPDKEFLYDGNQYDMTFKIDNQTSSPYTNLLITNASEVIISNISLNKISIGDKTYTSDKINRNKSNSYFLESQSSKNLILIYPDKHFFNETSETINFNFQLTTIYSKTYIQEIIIKHKPNDHKYDTTNATCVTINNNITGGKINEK